MVQVVIPRFDLNKIIRLHHSGGDTKEIVLPLVDYCRELQDTVCILKQQMEDIKNASTRAERQPSRDEEDT